MAARSVKYRHLVTRDPRVSEDSLDQVHLHRWSHREHTLVLDAVKTSLGRGIAIIMYGQCTSDRSDALNASPDSRRRVTQIGMCGLSTTACGRTSARHAPACFQKGTSYAGTRKPFTKSAGHLFVQSVHRDLESWEIFDSTLDPYIQSTSLVQGPTPAAPGSITRYNRSSRWLFDEIALLPDLALRDLDSDVTSSPLMYRPVVLVTVKEPRRSMWSGWLAISCPTNPLAICSGLFLYMAAE